MPKQIIIISYFRYTAILINIVINNTICMHQDYMAKHNKTVMPNLFQHRRIILDGLN